MYCVSCHADHNYWNGTANNLRYSITDADPSGAGESTNTDFISGGSPSYGICLSCHEKQKALLSAVGRLDREYQELERESDSLLGRAPGHTLHGAARRHGESDHNSETDHPSFGFQHGSSPTVR